MTPRMEQFARTETITLGAILKHVSQKPGLYEVANPMLQELQVAGITALKHRHHSRLWTPITVAGVRTPLYLITQGNAFVYRLKTSELEEFAGRAERNEVRKADIKISSVHPLILSEGDLVGEFEVLGNRPAAVTVLAGLPFRQAGLSASRKCCTKLLEMPVDTINSGVIANVASAAGNRKWVAANAVIWANVIQGAFNRLTALLPHFFAGSLPVFTAFVSDSGRKLAEMTFQEGAALGRCTSSGAIRGVEVSTKYLELFGFTSHVLRQALDSFTIQSEVYWRRRFEQESEGNTNVLATTGRRTQGPREHPRFAQNTEGAQKQPRTAEGILFFLGAELTTVDYLARHGEHVYREAEQKKKATIVSSLERSRSLKPSGRHG